VAGFHTAALDPGGHISQKYRCHESEVGYEVLRT
jgi:hypothetical protein